MAWFLAAATASRMLLLAGGTSSLIGAFVSRSIHMMRSFCPFCGSNGLVRWP
jgi:hypothetical protein